ncbi:MFS transporter [Promicromonospora sp. NPDC050880]|uniref:MFS transporter n=1 Tax=Promicromonospora sp. NPDC050880 TaxID=3364406 RepID=UPI0037BD2874
MSSPDPGAHDDGRTRSRRRDLLLLCSVVVLLMSAVSVANLSVPVLAVSDLAPDTSQQTWFVDAFVIAFACLLLPAEMLGARFGEERVLLLGLVLFALASLLALVASDMTLLIASRAVAGVGAGMALPQSLSVLLHRSARAGHPRIVATWTASTSVAGMVGNGLGGLLVSFGGWRSAFAVTLPLTVLTVVLVAAVVGVRRRPDRSAVLDLPGTAYFVVGAMAALVTLIEAPNLLDQPWLLAVPAVVAVVAAVAFWRTERHRTQPLLHFAVFRYPAVRAAALGIVVTFASLFVLFSLNAHLVQTVRGMTPAVAGLALVPVSVAMFLVTYLSVPLVRRLGLNRVVLGGLTLSAVGFVLLATGLEGSFAGYEAALVVVGVGAGLCSSPLSTRLTMAYAQGGASGRAGAGVNSTLRELASAAGVGAAGVALAVAAPVSPTAPASAQAVLDAASALFLGVAALLLVCGAVLLVSSRPGRRPAG